MLFLHQSLLPSMPALCNYGKILIIMSIVFAVLSFWIVLWGIGISGAIYLLAKVFVSILTTGRARLIRSHSSARFSFELSRNLN